MKNIEGVQALLEEWIEKYEELHPDIKKSKQKNIIPP
jgi:hypothetical protein